MHVLRHRSAPGWLWVVHDVRENVLHRPGDDAALRALRHTHATPRHRHLYLTRVSVQPCKDRTSRGAGAVGPKP